MNSSLSSPVSSQKSSCKCCGATAELFGVVDFNKSCEEVRRPHLLPLSGIPVYYHRCPRCGFIFTTAFDHFTPQDFVTNIYNEGYAAVDPDYVESRPTGNAAIIAQLFGQTRAISILDFGGGNGVFADRLRAAGFADVTTYDPFVPRHAERPGRQFDLVVAFEVVEHGHRPRDTFAEMGTFLKPDGILFFSTLLQPQDVNVSWWYLSPRNGHVSLYTSAAMQAVLGSMGFKVGSINQNLHSAWRTVPDFARHFIRV